jgi:hypothetical protein
MGIGITSKVLLRNVYQAHLFELIGGIEKMALKTSFAELGQNIVTRRFGGTTVGVADPYVTGYHFIWFDKLPPGLPSYTSTGISGLSSVSEIQNVLAASCLSVTPPGGTLNKIEFTGLGGVKWAVPGNIDYGNAVSVKFLEFNKTPILDIMHGWVKLIRDYRTGVTDLEDGEQGGGYSKSSYAGLLYYWTTAPDAKTVEYYACYDGVFPTKDPQDLFTSDVETVARLDVEIEFNCDYVWHEPWVKTKAETFVSAYADALDIVKGYGQQQAGG